MNAEKEARIKSWVLMVGGMTGIGYQQYTGKTDWVLLLIFTALTGVPGLTTLISMIRNSTTVLQSSLSLPEDSEPELESSSNNSSEVESE